MSADQQLRKMLTPAFRFVVTIDGEALAAFTECTLPTMDLDVETVKEGGLNTYQHQLPGPRKAATISLKNGVGVARRLLALYSNAMSGQPTRVHVTVTLLSPLLTQIMVLDIKDACPVKWIGPQLKTDDNTVAIQTLELTCGEVTVA
jgi:phage tail-like protein